jgi:hypothetical protein
MLFNFFWVFCTSLPNQVEHTCLKFQLQICKYEWARIIFVDGGLDSKLQHYGPCKNSWKKSKTSHSDRSGHIEGNVMQNHEQKEKWKKVKNQDLMGKTNYFLRTLPFSPWAVSATWLLLKKYMKNELNTCFQQKFATGSYGVGIGRAWCSRKACEICSSLI